MDIYTCRKCGTTYRSRNKGSKYCSKVCKFACLRAAVDPDKLKEFQRAGWQQKDIAKYFNTSSQAVGKALKRHGLPPIKRNCFGKNSSQWKGVKAGYSGFHRRVRQVRGAPSHCDECKLSDPTVRYEWANLTGHYEDIGDYRRMCVSCHRKYDGPARRKTHCKHGHPLTADNLYSSRTGNRVCKTCSLRNTRNYLLRKTTKRRLSEVQVNLF